MKFFAIIISIIFIVFIVIQAFAMTGQNNIELYPYQVEKTYENFEIRNYEASLFTSVKIPTNEYKNASSQGFRILAGYIFGNNDRNEKIAMTSPVAMSLEDSITMMFMVPKNLNLDMLPNPIESNIEFREEPAKTVAAITFSGWANDKSIDQHKKKLIEALEANNISFTNRFYFFGYNPPYEVINRKNEIIVELY